MNKKAKSFFSSVAQKIKFFLGYLFALLKPSARNICVILICSLAVFGFYDTAAWFGIGKLYRIAIKSFYVFMVAVCLISAAVTTYKAGKKHLVSPSGTESFRYFNGFLIGLITAAPFIAMCIAAHAKEFTYYTSDSVVELEKLFLYVYAFRFSEYPTATDFSYLLFMALALVPIAVCALSYVAPKITGHIRERGNRKKEAV